MSRCLENGIESLALRLSQDLIPLVDQEGEDRMPVSKLNSISEVKTAMSSSPIHLFRVLPYSQSNNCTIIYLFLTVLSAQMVIILLLLFKSRFRKPLIIWLDGLKRGKAQLVVKSLSATVFAVMMYSIYSVVDFRSRSVNFSNHVILAYHILEAYLMGFSLFLLLTIGYLHTYITEVVTVTEAIRDLRTQNRAYEESTKKSADEVKVLRKEISRLKTEITNLESELNMKEQAVQLQKTESSDLKNTVEGLVEEYYRLLAHNKDLRDQLQDINKRLSPSSGRKSVLFSWGQWGL